MTTARDDIAFLGLAGRDTVDEMRSFIDRHGLDDFEHIIDADGSLWERFEIVSQPSWVFVDDDGTTKRLFGGLGEDGLNAEIDALLAT